jgi:phosphoserine aminotransferase
MGERVWNFSAGPAMLPPAVVARAREGIREIDGSGMSILEISHRSAIFEGIVREAEANLRELLSVPPTHRVLFLAGGASLQFSMVPMSLLRGAGRPADYVVTGSWGTKALVEARREGPVNVAWSGADENFVRVPGPEELTGLGRDAAYVHFTSNETIQGVEWPKEPIVPPGTPLVCDMSSDFLSRPTDLGRYGLVYAGAQKNAGPAGVTIVLVSDDVLERAPADLPSMLDYRTHVGAGSLYNTPPTYALYVVLLTTRWLRDEVGGLASMARSNARKAAMLYDELDASGGFYAGHARPGSRSNMNVTFRLPTEGQEIRFLEQAAAHGLLELRGHRSVGGIRASIYNAMPSEGVAALRDFMRSFRRTEG